MIAAINPTTTPKPLLSLAGTVLDATPEHEKLSLEVLDNEQSGRQFALLVLKILTAVRGLGADEQAVG